MVVYSRVIGVDELARAEVHVQGAFTRTLTFRLLHALAVQAQPVILRPTPTTQSVKVSNHSLTCPLNQPATISISQSDSKSVTPSIDVSASISMSVTQSTVKLASAYVSQ